MLNSTVGEREALKQMKRLFKGQRIQQNKIRMMQEEERRRELDELMETNFAAEMQNQILEAFAE